MGIRWPTRAGFKRLLVDVVLLVAVVFGVQAWQQRDVPSGPAPAIAGTLADGSRFDLTTWRAGYPNRPIALHFWAEWCPICGKEEGSVTAVLADWPVMTVAMRSGSSAQVAAHLRDSGLAWPALVDADGHIAAAYGLKGVPALVVIDRDGTIRSVSTGYTTELGMRLRLWWADHFSPLLARSE